LRFPGPAPQPSTRPRQPRSAPPESTAPMPALEPRSAGWPDNRRPRPPPGSRPQAPQTQVDSTSDVLLDLEGYGGKARTRAPCSGDAVTRCKPTAYQNGPGRGSVPST